MKYESERGSRTTSTTERGCGNNGDTDSRTSTAAVLAPIQLTMHTLLNTHPGLD